MPVSSLSFLPRIYDPILINDFSHPCSDYSVQEVEQVPLISHYYQHT